MFDVSRGTFKRMETSVIGVKANTVITNNSTSGNKTVNLHGLLFSS